MALLPSRNYSEQAATNILFDLRKGNQQARNEFIWQHQERFYAIAFLAAGEPEVAIQLTIVAFKNALAAIKQINPKQIAGSTWEWLSQFIVDACAEYHMQYTGAVPTDSTADPTADGSSQMDWETTVVLGAHRVKRCLTLLPPEQRHAYILRHQFGLRIDQVATVLNQNLNNVIAWLFLSRVQLIKCLGRG